MLGKVYGRILWKRLEKVYKFEEKGKANIRQHLGTHPTYFNSGDPRPGSFSTAAGTDPGPYPSCYFCHPCS